LPGWLDLYLYAHPPRPALPPFPTRRSSDLGHAAQADSPRRSPGRAAARRQEGERHPALSVLIVRCSIEETTNKLIGRNETRTDRSEEHTSELQSRSDLVCRLLLEKKNTAPA